MLGACLRYIFVTFHLINTIRLEQKLLLQKFNLSFQNQTREKGRGESVKQIRNTSYVQI